MGGCLKSERSEDSLCEAQPFCEAEYRHAEGVDMNQGLRRDPCVSMGGCLKSERSEDSLCGDDTGTVLLSQNVTGEPSPCHLHVISSGRNYSLHNVRSSRRRAICPFFYLLSLMRLFPPLPRLAAVSQESYRDFPLSIRTYKNLPSIILDLLFFQPACTSLRKAYRLS